MNSELYNELNTIETTDGLLARAKRAVRQLSRIDGELRRRLLVSVADALEAAAGEILAANALDLARMDPSNPRYDRLLLNEERIASIASDMRHVATLPSPLTDLEQRTLQNGLRLRRTAVPFGVVGVIFESRPNVAADVFALCFATANVAVLKGSHEAADSVEAIVNVIKRTLRENGVDDDAVILLPAPREATARLLEARGTVDLIIPRGSSRLIQFVRDNARVPVIETGAGVCHCFVERTADPAMATRIADNAKTRRVSVCNALDCLLIDRPALAMLSEIARPLAEKGVKIHADKEAFSVLAQTYPSDLLSLATDEDFGTEFLAMEMAVKTVDGTDEAIAHIDRYGSGHSESIVTTDAEAAATFRREVDAACVYVNAPTSFTDGAQFGLGAEIGISTQKLHARGPMALRELTTYKWLVDGDGQIRP